MEKDNIGPHQQFNADKTLELEPKIVKIATANKSQGRYRTL